jgi:hypothetical protein
MTALCKSILATATIALAASSLAGQGVVGIRVGQPVSSEALSILAKYKKCGSEGETHATQDGRSSTTTWTRSYRAPDSGDFLQVVTVNDTVARLFWKPAGTEAEDDWNTEFQQVTQVSISASTLRVTGAAPVEPKKKAEQAGAGQPATRSELDSERGDNPQPESEGRSR